MTQNDVDVAKEIADDVQQTLECSDAYRNVVEKRITEALAGRWAKDEDVLNFARECEQHGIPLKSHKEFLPQFKSERGI